MKYELIWRNKWLTAEAKTMREMAEMLENAANHLRELAADGVVLREGDSTSDDYAFLETDDPEVAAKHGFHEVEEMEDEDVPAL